MSLDDVRRQSTTNDMRGEGIEATGDEVSKFQQSEALVSRLFHVHSKFGDKMGSKHHGKALGCPFGSDQYGTTDKASARGIALPLPCIISTIFKKDILDQN